MITTGRLVMSASQRGAEAIIAALAGAGTQLVFGVPGGGPNLDVVGAAAGAGLRFILAHGETAAAIMAATCADLTGAPGAVLVTRGPGLASAANGIAHAALDRLPVVVIADTVPARDAGRISHQRLDQAALGRSVAKATVALGDRDAGQAAGLAVRLALATPAGPVVVNMDPGEMDPPGGEPASPGAASLNPPGLDAADLNPPGQGAADLNPPGQGAADLNPPGQGAAGPHLRGPRHDPPLPGTASTARVTVGSSRPASHDLAPLASALAEARRPVVLLGPGALAHTRAVRAALAGTGIPVLHTYRARGIMPDSSAEAAGLVTGGTMEWPLLTAADLIVGLGVDPAEMIPAVWDYAAPTVLVTEPGHRRGGDTGLGAPGEYSGAGGEPGPVGTDVAAGYFTGATELPAQIPAAVGLVAAHRHQWPAGVGRAVKKDISARLWQAAITGPGLLSPQDVVATVGAHTPPETIATVDAGAHMLVVMPLWEVDEPHRLLISSGLATMGYALPAAIAAALCRPGGPVVAFTGDGGLGMTLMEIETAVRLRLRVVVVVFNDATLSLIKIKQREAGHGGRDAVGYRPTSFAGAATALGAFGVPVCDVAELTSALAAALDRDGPTVIDARTDPAAYPAVMDLTRGEAGRRGSPGLRPATVAPLPGAEKKGPRHDGP
jgi:acetolactate synthase-1/2/3 large subunit